jgi:hypothetical protein
MSAPDVAPEGCLRGRGPGERPLLDGLFGGRPNDLSVSGGLIKY